MQKFFYISKNQQTLGPYSLERIQDLVERRQLSATDYIYLEDIQDWITLLEFLPTKANAKKTGAKNPATDLTADDWFVLKDEKRFGPYSFSEVLKMLEEKSVYEYDYVWRPGMEEWKKVSELDDFSPSSSKLKQANPNSPMLRRKYPRAAFGTSLVVHNQRKIWKGESFEIGEGGCRVKIATSALTVGDHIHVLFKPSDFLPPFHAVCEVLSAKPDLHGTNSYSLKFLEVAKSIKKEIKLFTKKSA